MTKFYTILFLAFSVLLFSCKSASKLYEKGNYDEAVEVAVKKLQKDPDDRKLRVLIQDAYRFAVNDHEDRIRNHSESSSELKWDYIYHEYADLQKLYNAIYRSPVVYELVQPKDYSSYLNTYADKAADVHYERGMQWMNSANKQHFKTAYREFQYALSFKPGSMNFQQMRNEAFDLAVTRVVIAPVEDRIFRFSSYGLNQTNFENDLIRNLQNNSGNEFVRFYSAWDAQNRNIIADEIIEVRFNHFDIGRIQDQKTIREVSKDVVIKETVYRPDSIVKEYARVKAKIITTKRTMISEGVMAVNIRSNNGAWIGNDQVRGSHGWTTEFTTYTGDERALSNEDKNLINKSTSIAPRDEEIIRCIKESIYNDFVQRMRNHYSRY